MADLLILTGDVNITRKELLKAEIKKDYIVYTGQEIKGKIWNKLNLIKVYTKEPGKKPRFPPFALKKDSTVEDAAKEIHKPLAVALFDIRGFAEEQTQLLLSQHIPTYSEAKRAAMALFKMADYAERRARV